MDIGASKSARGGLAALFGLLVIFLYAPLVVLAIFSFNDDVVAAFPLSGFTTRWYEEFIHNTELLGALKTSAVVAAMSSAISVALGLLAAIVLVRRSFFGKSALSALLLSPLVIPYIAFAIALLILFNQSGVPLSILTVTIGHVVVILPYTILVLAPRLQQIDVRLEEAARDLGAGALRTFRSITLPLIAPAIVAALIIAFTASFDEIQIALFVVGDEPTFPIYLYGQLRFPQRLPQMLAVAVVVLVGTMLVFLAVLAARRAVERRLDTEVVRPEEGA